MANDAPNERFRLRSVIDAWDYLAIVLVPIAAAVVILSGTFIASPSDTVRNWCWWGLVVGTLVYGVFPLISTYRAKKREFLLERAAHKRELDARMETQIEIGSALNNVVNSILKGASDLRSAKPEDAIAARRGFRETVQELAVNVAPQIIGPGKTDARSCYFDLDAGPPKRLVPTHMSGCVRYLEPKIRPFTEEHPHGQYVLNKVFENEPDFYPDLDKDAPPEFDISKLGYRTFISVPVASAYGEQDEAYGLLSLDATNADQLHERDFALMRVLAGLVTITMILARDVEGDASVLDCNLSSGAGTDAEGHTRDTGPTNRPLPEEKPARRRFVKRLRMRVFGDI